MDPLLPNPGGQLALDEIVGREREIKRYWRVLDRQSLVLSAERRIGKTQLVKKMHGIPREGFVSSGRESWYELAEPLMRICIDVKDNRTRHLRTFVELMRRWFSADEMRDRLGVIEREGQRRPVDRAHLEAALREHAEQGKDSFLDALDARDGPSDDTALLRARALFDLDRFDEAWAALSTRARAADQTPNWHAMFVATEAAAVSPDAALRRLEKLLKTATLDLSNGVTAWLIAKLLIVTARAHGAMALAGFLPRLRASLSSHRLVPLLAGGVVALLQDLNAHRDRITAEWDLALPRVMEALADVEDTELALQMLSVLVRHVRSGDPTVLLELPLETRQLLALPDQSAAPREA